MKFAKIENKTVIQVQPNEQDGFVEVEGNVVCGMVLNDEEVFIAPEIVEAEIRVTLKQIKEEAGRRITESSHDWMAIRKITTGEPIAQKVLNYAVAVRAASEALEANLPADYYDDKHWPARV